MARLLKAELPRLEDEITSPVSKRGNLFIRQQLKRLDTEPVTFRLPEEVVSALDVICEKKNIVRDALFNRLLFALCTKPHAFLALMNVAVEEREIEPWLSDAGWDTQGEEFGKGPLDVAISALNDPLWVIRACLETASKAAGEENMYTFYENPLTVKGLTGFEGLNVCYSSPAENMELIDRLLATVEVDDRTRSIK